MERLNLVRRRDLEVSPRIKDERRGYTRFIIDTAAHFKEPHREDLHEGTCKDISAGGLRMVTNKKLRSEDMIELWVPIASGKEPVRLVGNVQWLKELGEGFWDAGIKFKDVQFMSLAPLFRTI